MSFKCAKCLRIKPSNFFTKILNEENICDFCRGKIEEQSVKRETEMKRFINCENKTPVLKKYGETAEAKKTAKIRRSIDCILEDKKLARELKDYE